jgi:putative Mn2+ efflux pump MntP
MTQYANQQDSRKGMFFLFALTAILMPNLAFAATTGAEFQAVYDFVYGAATGYLGRSICIVGGLIGLGFGAASGKALPAILGVVLAIFGALGPTIVNALFDSALI